ncbi:MAG: sel1 repeat family protein [Hyphomicrobiaceae bacterium]|nr:sel1 repeat family protein [Hyphomicrobiaceae bacterium]
MNQVSIQVLRHPDHDQPGHAVILLAGLSTLPSGATYSVSPLDEEDNETTGWPERDLRPAEVRTTERGIELVVGPEVVDAPALQPGTPVSVSIPDAGLTGELLWPSLVPSQSTRRRTVVVSAADHAANMQAAQANAAKAEAAETAAATEPGVAMPMQSDNPKAEGAVTEALSSLDLPPSSSIKLPNGTEVASALAKGDATDRSASVATAPAATDDLARYAPSPTNLARASSTPTAAHSPDEATTKPAPTPNSAVENDAERKGVDQRTRYRGRLGFVSGVGVAAAAAAAALWLVPGLGVWVTGGRAPVAANFAPVQRTLSRVSFKEIVDIPSASPLGVAAAGVTLTEALRRADEDLRSSDKSRREEARYWLRHSISIGLGDGRMRWAMTQLGTLYAAPGQGKPNFAAARALWEVAGAKGDPVALCFLALLHERGLSTHKDLRRALELFEAAKLRGGCQGIEKAISRLKKSVS